MQKINYKIPENCNFDDITHAFSSNSCSPKILKPMFEGIIINVPDKIKLTDDMKAFIACSFSFSNKTDLGIFGNVRNEIVFTVVDAKNHTPVSGKVPAIQNSIPMPPSRNVQIKKSNTEKESSSIPLQYLRGYVNLDMFDVVNAPKKVGKYIVFATLSTYKSNILEFEIINP